MPDTNDRPIAVLNSLIETTVGSAYGYKEAAVDAHGLNFKSQFEGRWLHRKQLTAELQHLLRGLGGAPDEDDTMLAAERRIFFGLRHTMADSDPSIIDALEVGEDRIKARFEAALADGDLPPGAKAVVTRIPRSVQADQDQMRDLKHALHAGRQPDASPSARSSFAHGM